MTLRFKMKTGETFETESFSNLNILAHAQILEIDIGSQCGGHCICGGDLIKIPEKYAKKLTPPTPEELEKIASLELPKDKSNLRLACQCFPIQNGIAIKIGVLNS